MKKRKKREEKKEKKKGEERGRCAHQTDGYEERAGPRQREQRARDLDLCAREEERTGAQYTAARIERNGMKTAIA